MPEHLPRGRKEMRETKSSWEGRGVNVRSTLWCGPRGGAPFAVACMTLLAGHKGPVWPFTNGETGCVLAEAFPAAQLCHWQLPHTGYSRQVSTPVRERIILWLERERGLSLKARERGKCLDFADALDAVICAYAAAAVANGKPEIGSEGTSVTEGLTAIHY